MTSLIEEAKQAAENQAVLYSQRCGKGKYLQKLILATARAMLPALDHLDSQAGHVVLHASEDEARLSVYSSKSVSIHLPDDVRSEVALLASALSRQISRLIGGGTFSLSTGRSSSPMQIVFLSLFSESGAEIRMNGSSFSANVAFHNIVAISNELDEVLGAEPRQTADLDLAIAKGALQAFPVARPLGKFARSLRVIPSTTMVFECEDELEQLRSTCCVPDLIKSLESYEAKLNFSNQYRKSVFGQDDQMAEPRTVKRKEKLNPRLTADLVPMSRSVKLTPTEDLIRLANERPLSHLAIEFGISDVALKKRLTKAGWTSPRARVRAAA